ncbi:hypothetical protein MINTM008_28590 [Mycobacterium intracellulare]|nr:hypothetical protein MINTM002_25500 [Mycobacterium intracellulare]BCO62697.1 hypothetical protein MINTM006_26470 [Mycobacterium intracellulare]BCO73524.1 hypothetical protein MINTM008_28590 [Mycobacterium intracellulare]BCO78966.1 hypothetical protein MINTM009_27480 [Mycobacterium intracellulare]BCP20964.1 hypothetical protein MINTM023_27530 [Mycobacterium intracellulare]
MLTWGGADASTLLPLLQPTVISATAARPATAAWRYAIVLMGFLSRLPVVSINVQLTSSPGRDHNPTTRVAQAIAV